MRLALTSSHPAPVVAAEGSRGRPRRCDRPPVLAFLAGIALIVAGTTRTWRSVWPWPVACIPVVIVLALLPFPNAIALTVAIAAALLVLAVHGTLASRQNNTVLSGAQ